MPAEITVSDHPYTYIWSFEVAAENVAEFERVYGPDGDWAALLRSAAGYRWTQLLKDRDHAGRYLTVDTWDSAEAFEAFRAAQAEAFEALDRRCEGLTLRETLVGCFDRTGPGE